jgi:hypothetical protein
MAVRLSPMLLLPPVLVASIAAYMFTDRSAPAAPVQAEVTASADVDDDTAGGAPTGALPPNHPPVGGASPHGMHGGGAMPGAPQAPNGDNEMPASITWTAPKAFQPQPNPNAMRLATYKVGAGAELSVARAGGTTDANVERWQSQFDGSAKAARSTKQVRGLAVTVVRIDGTFVGGGMSGAPEKHDGWSMLAAIVESSGSPYFFKMLGPTAQIDGARASFDALVASVTPKPGE